MTFDPSQYKAGLLEPVDMTAFEIVTRGRTIRPYDGESVWLEPYIDSSTELKLMRAREELGENPENEAAFEMMCQVLADMTLGWNLTDKFGQPLPPPDTAEAFMALPSRAVLFLLNEALGIEPEGNAPGA